VGDRKMEGKKNRKRENIKGKWKNLGKMCNKRQMIKR
jgi:hypothetical protein